MDSIIKENQSYADTQDFLLGTLAEISVNDAQSKAIPKVIEVSRLIKQLAATPSQSQCSWAYTIIRTPTEIRINGTCCGSAAHFVAKLGDE